MEISINPKNIFRFTTSSLLMIIFFLLLLCSVRCAPYPIASDFSGNKLMLDPDRISQIQPGKSAKDDIRRLLGEPGMISTTSKSPDLEFWGYTYTGRFGRASGRTFSIAMLIIYFDRNGIVSHGKATYSGTDVNSPTVSKWMKVAQKLDTRSERAREPVGTFIELPKVTWDLANLAVSELSSTAISQEEARTLSGVLRDAIVNTKYFKVVSLEDMEAVLREQQFQKSGMCDDTKCLVDMGKILAVQKMVGGSIGKVGETFQMTVRMVNVETGQIEHSVSRSLNGTSDKLIEATSIMGRELCLEYARGTRKGNSQ